MFNIYLAKGSDGKKLYSTSTRAPRPRSTMQREAVLPGHHRRAGRQAAGLPGRDRAPTVKDVCGAAGAPQLKLEDKDTVLFVIDVLSVEPNDVLDGPQGTKVAAPAERRRRSWRSGGKVTGLDFSKAPRSRRRKLQVIPLVEGDGRPVAKAGQPGHRSTTRRVYGAEEAVRRLLQPRRAGAVRRRRHGPDPGLGQGLIPGLKAGQPGADHRPARRRLRHDGSRRPASRRNSTR